MCVACVEVSLVEYVKVEDSLYQVDNKALVPENKLQYTKTLTFQVWHPTPIPSHSYTDLPSSTELLYFVPEINHCYRRYRIAKNVMEIEIVIIFCVRTFLLFRTQCLAVCSSCT